MNTPTNPPVPDWGERLLATLADAVTIGAQPGRLTTVEHRILDAAWLTIRAKFGRTSLDDPAPVIRFLLQGVVDDLKGGQR